MEEVEEVAPDQATNQRSLLLRERSSRERTWGRRPERVDWSVSIKLRGSETKQLSMPPTTLTSNSIDYPETKNDHNSILKKTKKKMELEGAELCRFESPEVLS